MFLVFIETRLFYKVLEMIKDCVPGYYKYQKRIRFCKYVDEDNEQLDNDVADEQQRIVSNFDPYGDVLKVRGLKKKFRRYIKKRKLYAL